MATVVKDFKVKAGLVVEGANATVGGYDVLKKENEADEAYIVGLIGGTATPINTPDTVVKRDGNGDFAAGTVSVNRINFGTDGFIEGDGDGDIDIVATGDDVRITADDIRLNAIDDIILSAGDEGSVDGDVVLTTSGGNIRLDAEYVYVGSNEVDSERVATRGYVDDAVDAAQGDITDHTSATSGVHGVTGNVVGDTDTQTLTNKTLGSGTNLSVNLDMNGNKIEDLGTPTAGTDAATKNYVDEADTATLGSANLYTDGRETAITTAYQSYADQAEVDAKAYTDTRETAITSAYQTYADQAETDAVATARAYTDQAELDAVDAAATAAAALYAPLAGATFTGEVILSGDPTQALGAATKQYVDAVAEGLHVHASVALATTGNISNLSDGPSSIDGVSLNDTLGVYTRVLIKDQTTASENGIYVATKNGSGKWVYTRAEDYNTVAEVDSGDFVFVTEGTAYAKTGWVQENNITTLGTDPISWSQFSGAGEYTAGTGLELNGTTFSIDEDYTATKSYVDGEIIDLDASLKLYADAAETDAKAYTDARETAITTAYQSYADLAETDAKSHADSVALTAENNAKAYTDTRETAITTAYRNYADLAEADAKLYTDDEIAALTTNDIEEGVNNLYFTNQRAIDAVGGTIGDAIGELTTDDIEEGATNLYFTDERAADVAGTLLANATQTNIQISYNSATNSLEIEAENGVADSTTDDLTEGEANLYFTNARAVSALEAVVPNFTEIDINDVATQVAASSSGDASQAVVAYQFPTADYRSAKFLVKVAYSTHTEVSEVLLTLDTADNIAITEYAVVGTNGVASAITADVSGGNVRLIVTPANNASTIKVMGTLLV